MHLSYLFLGYGECRPSTRTTRLGLHPNHKARSSSVKHYTSSKQQVFASISEGPSRIADSRGHLGGASTISCKQGKYMPVCKSGLSTTTKVRAS